MVQGLTHGGIVGGSVPSMMRFSKFRPLATRSSANLKIPTVSSIVGRGEREKGERGKSKREGKEKNRWGEMTVRRRE